MSHDPNQIMPGPYQFRRGDYTAADAMDVWPRAAAELSGFADYLASNGRSITAGQIRLALWLAEQHFRSLPREDFPP